MRPVAWPWSISCDLGTQMQGFGVSSSRALAVVPLGGLAPPPGLGVGAFLPSHPDLTASATLLFTKASITIGNSLFLKREASSVFLSGPKRACTVCSQRDRGEGLHCVQCPPACMPHTTSCTTWRLWVHLWVARKPASEISH